MNIIYTVTIKGSKNTIEFKTAENSNSAITGVQLSFNSRDDSQDRDKDGRTEIVIKGKYDNRPESLYAINDLAEWARADSDVYREITIVEETKTGSSEKQQNFKRTYHFDAMFCIDYHERTGACLDKDSKASLEFELFLAQGPDYSISETKSEIIS
jgi:hypothetical protein